MGLVTESRMGKGNTMRNFQKKKICGKGEYGANQMHSKENPIHVSLFWEWHVLSPNFHTHVSVSDSYILIIGPHISLQQNRQTDPGNI